MTAKQILIELRTDLEIGIKNELTEVIAELNKAINKL